MWVCISINHSLGRRGEMNNTNKEVLKEVLVNREVLQEIAETVESVPTAPLTTKERKARQKEQLAWWTKWFSSIIVMIAMTLRSTGEPALLTWDLYLSTLGIFGWLIVSLLWKDRALILLNGFGLLILASGVLKNFF